MQALQFGDPLGYDSGMARDFAELKASCSAGSGSYTYASPTAYAINATATDDSTPKFTPPSTCTGSYVPKSGDDCNSVAKKMGTSTFSMVIANGLDLYCQNFGATINRSLSLCTPPRCETYTWKNFDTCNDVSRQHGISVAHFLSWNPNFDSICRNRINFVGFQVCVS